MNKRLQKKGDPHTSKVVPDVDNAEQPDPAVREHRVSKITGKEHGVGFNSSDDAAVVPSPDTWVPPSQSAYECFYCLHCAFVSIPRNLCYLASFM